MPRLVVPALAVLALAACTDFATPNQLERPTIIAVVADPPVIAPGTTATVAVVVADAAGVLTMPPTTWALIEAYPGVAPLGTITGDAAGALYTAPATIPDRGDIPPVDTAAVTVETSAGPLTAIKAMPVLPAATANPTLTALTVAGADALAGTATVTRGATVALTVTTDPPATGDARFAWYTPVGDIQYYQSNPCELVVPMDAASGPLIVVIRDGVGGVVWQQIALTVD
ncbi:MAG: hypothetical protein IPL61_33675 [Myxococcales bacterium]|nr:hypothetical protein [Myxococcales bacterium]